MKRRILVALTLTGVSFPLSVAPVRAETGAQLMSKSCPAAFAAGKKGLQAEASADDSRYALEKRAASLYHDCYNRLHDPHARDLAHVFYLQSLSQSISPSDHRDKMIEIYTLVVTGAGDLATSTAFPDVRKAALFTQSEATRMLDQLESGSP
jgi:hypothetical protein